MFELMDYIEAMTESPATCKNLFRAIWKELFCESLQLCWQGQQKNVYRVQIFCVLIEGSERERERERERVRERDWIAFGDRKCAACYFVLEVVMPATLYLKMWCKLLCTCSTLCIWSYVTPRLNSFIIT